VGRFISTHHAEVNDGGVHPPHAATASELPLIVTATGPKARSAR
jgi:hypothetical protein